MRKIEQDMLQAIRNGEDWSEGNTAVVHTDSFNYAVKLHGMAGVGYATNSAGERVCYACCAVADEKQMQEDGKITLYLESSPTREANTVTNWPGSLKFRVVFWKKSKHAFGHNMIIAYFKDSNGAWWSAKNIGDTQIAHCRRLAQSTVKRERL